MKIFVINPGSTSTKIALFIDEKPVWVAGAHHTADDLSEFHHVNEQYEYRKNFILRLLAEADIPLDFDAVIARGGLLKPTPGGDTTLVSSFIFSLIFPFNKAIKQFTAVPSIKSLRGKIQNK